MTVTRDATSGWAVPAGSSEWTAFLSGWGLSIANPGSLWSCQETSGTLADSIGTLTLPSEGSRQSYRNVVSGWTRLALNSVGDGWYRSGSPAVDPATTSSMTLVIAESSVVQSIIIAANSAQSWAGLIDGSGKLAVHSSGGSVASGTSNPLSVVRPFAYKLDRSRSVGVVYDDQEHVSVALGSPTVAGAYFASSSLSATTSFLYGVQWTGSAAEMSDATVATLFALIQNPILTLAVSPATATIVPAGSTTLSATAHKLDTTTQDVSTVTVWTTSDAGVATVNSGGVVTGVGVGTCTITATTGGVAGTASITVSSGGIPTTKTWIYGQGLLTNQTTTGAHETDHHPTAGRASGVFRYDGSDVIWTGDRLLVNNEGGRAVGSSAFWSTDGTVLPYGIPAYLPLETLTAPPDAIGGAYVETCVTDTLRFVVGQPVGGQHVNAWVINRATSALVSVTDLGGGTTPVDLRAFASGDFVVCLFRNQADGALYINSWTGNGWTGASNVDNGVGSYDVALVPGGFHMLWRVGSVIRVGAYAGNSSQALPYTFGTALSHTTTPNGNVALAVAPDGELAIAFSAGSDGLQAVTYSSAAAKVNQAQLSSDTSNWDGITISARTLRPELSSGTTHYPFVVHGGISGKNVVHLWEFTGYNPATVIRTDTKFNSRLASKSFVVGNEVFAWLRGTNASTNYLIAGARAPLTCGYADREEAVARAITADHVGATAMVSPDPTGELVFTWARPFDTGQTYAHGGNVRIGDLNFLPQLSTAAYGKAVYLSGCAVKTWDGVRLLDTGFQEYPTVENVTSDASAGALTAGGAYQWNIYAVRYNAENERFVSSAVTLSATLGVSDTEAVISINTLPTTEPGVILEVYRTEAGPGETFYLEGTVGNDSNTGIVAFTSTISDAVLSNGTRVEDPFAPGIGVTPQLMEFGPLGCEILSTASDRLWGAGGQVPAGYVQFSKLKDDGAGAGFDDLAGFLEIDTQNSAITSVIGYNGAIVIFQRERISVVSDAGPDNTGAGSFAAPQLVLADGAINGVGTVVTQAGIFFWGVDGPRLLGLDLKVSNISLPITALTSTLTPTCSQADLVRQEVVWFTAGGTAVLANYLTGTPRWAQWSGLEIAGATEFSLVTTDGRLLIESPDALGDADVPFAFSGATGNIRPEQVLSGTTMLRAVGITGAYEGPHVLRLRVYYNASPLWTDEFTWQPDTNTWLSEGEDFSALTPAQVDGLAPTDRSGGYATHKRVSRQHCRHFLVEWSDVSAMGPTMTPYEISLELGSLGGLGRTPPATFGS